ncbi:M48 family metallopeptidase [Ruixingdingia sedimenti]|uniref:M48 family metallopeptidase n=1 Tax=Ruixingdingia sedimenti TaxID=3073604 RepID=A0ABU1F4L4_9RHOB|nr:M48 family metallopeptidase [Xinfangfangia sp. LG-4]MDR5651811.1 M48 family metallopeptidase [Xinfangfangia sp. LG-4]
MLKFAPILLAILYAMAMYWFSAWRTRKMLAENAAELADPELRRQAARLAEALDLPKITVNLFEVEPVNGLAAPDGQIYITRGFYQRYRRGEVTAEEIASVIAHELGHVALGHTRRRMIDFSGQNAVFVTLVALILRAVPVVGPLLAVMVARLVTGALAARLSRGDEYEADAWAAALLVKAGIGTAPQKSLFRKLPGLTGLREGAVPAWLMSHPAAADRIAAIEAREAQWGLVPRG